MPGKIALDAGRENWVTTDGLNAHMDVRSDTEVHMAQTPQRIHPTAVIDPAASLADDVTVGPYTVIDGPVTIGPGCRVGPHVHLIGPLTLGRNNVIHAGAVLGDRPQHAKFNGQTSPVVVGDGNVFREHVTIHAGMEPAGTRLGPSQLLHGRLSRRPRLSRSAMT